MGQRTQLGGHLVGQLTTPKKQAPWRAKLNRNVLSGNEPQIFGPVQRFTKVVERYDLIKVTNRRNTGRRENKRCPGG